MIILLIGVLLLSIGDLIMTLTYLNSFGMSEGNPLARLVMSYRSPWYLVVWKASSLTAACGILYIQRRRRAAEIGAWICTLILVWLTFRWSAYTGQAHFGPSASAAIQNDPSWVTLDTARPPPVMPRSR